MYGRLVDGSVIRQRMAGKDARMAAEMRRRQKKRMKIQRALKLSLAVAAFRGIADTLEHSPELSSPDRMYSSDDILDAFLNGFECQPFHSGEPDPTAIDSGPNELDFCVICEQEAHDANCPVGMLEEIWKIGISSDKLLKMNLGLKPKPSPLAERDPETWS